MSRRFYWVRFKGRPDWVPAERHQWGDDRWWAVPGNDMPIERKQLAEIGPELIPPATSTHRPRVLGKVNPGEVHQTLDGGQVLIAEADRKHGREVEDNAIHGLATWAADR